MAALCKVFLSSVQIKAVAHCGLIMLYSKKILKCFGLTFSDIWVCLSCWCKTCLNKQFLVEGLKIINVRNGQRILLILNRFKKPWDFMKAALYRKLRRGKLNREDGNFKAHYKRYVCTADGVCVCAVRANWVQIFQWLWQFVERLMQIRRGLIQEGSAAEMDELRTFTFIWSSLKITNLPQRLLLPHFPLFYP